MKYKNFNINRILWYFIKYTKKSSEILETQVRLVTLHGGDIGSVPLIK